MLCGNLPRFPFPECQVEGIMAEIHEVIGRQALIHAATNYQSVSEALMELVDNPLDYRGDRQLNIQVWIDRRKADGIVVFDHGGEGMDDNALRSWIHWGEGPDHRAVDIGQYRVGGKLAAIYLADGLSILSRKAGHQEIWRFEDHEWGTRTTPLSTRIETVDPAEFAWLVDQLDPADGFVLVHLTGLKKHRYEAEVLVSRLADAYGSLVSRGDCVIHVNGEPVVPWAMPWSNDVEIVPITSEMLDPPLSNVIVSGRIGALDRHLLKERRGAPVRTGIRTEFNGRKITDGESFGHNLTGRGTHARLYGELNIRGTGLLPNQLKNGWSRDSDEWRELHGLVHERMRVVLQRLDEIAGRTPVSSQEQSRANRAHKRFERTVKRLRKRLETEPQRPATLDRVTRAFIQRTEFINPVVLASLGENSPRTDWRIEEDGTRSIVINVDYPMYDHLAKHEDYFFASLVDHFAYDGSSSSPARDLVDEILWLDKAKPGGA